MEIDLSKIDQTQFMVHPCEFNGETMHLVQPQHIGCKWTQQNKFFRSSVWNSGGELVSCGFPKFVNWGENPDVFPVPTSLKNCDIIEKTDGSLLIVSKYKGKFIIRTRGTIDASKMNNGNEIETFKTKYASVFQFQPHYETRPFSLLFEWVSPDNRIVIRFNEPEFFLVGAIYHDTGKLWTQDWLDTLAKSWGCPRPTRYSFNSVPDLMFNINDWKNKEGVCVYSSDGQMIHKVKSSWYLVRHRLKEEFSSFEKLLDFYIEEKCPDFSTFSNRVSEVTDWETVTQLIGDISKCVDAKDTVLKIMKGMWVFVSQRLLPMGDPKDKKVRGEMAKLVISSYGKTNRTSMVFKILDNKELDNDDMKRLFYQVLKH